MSNKHRTCKIIFGEIVQQVRTPTPQAQCIVLPMERGVVRQYMAFRTGEILLLFNATARETRIKLSHATVHSKSLIRRYTNDIEEVSKAMFTYLKKQNNTALVE